MSVLRDATIVRQMRLVFGLVLFAFALTHFVNHALGLVSLDWMERMQVWRKELTRSEVGGLVLYAAILIHPVLGLAKLGRRRTLRLPAWEWVQILLGLLIPCLMFQHVFETRLATNELGHLDRYRHELVHLWQPERALWQGMLILIVWVHGCIGVHFWLRLRPTYCRIAPGLLVLAVIVPTLAVAGFTTAARAVAEERRDYAAAALQPAPAETDRYGPSSYDNPSNGGDPSYGNSPAYGSPAQSSPAYGGSANGGSYAAAQDPAAYDPAPVDAFSLTYVPDMRWAYFALLALLVTVPFAWRRLPFRAQRNIRVSYPDGTVAIGEPGSTLLEISRANGIAHTSICGGRARCSTCRVRVVEGEEHLPPADPMEARLLSRIKAPPHVRLACQCRPSGPVAVTPLVTEATLSKAGFEDEAETGIEREITVVFADLRGFTRMAEDKLPYDIVFLLNEYFQGQEAAIRKCGGQVDKYMGDGLMALFGVEGAPDQGAKAALIAAEAMVQRLKRFNERVKDQLPEPLQVAIGIHTGQAVLGAIGAGTARQVTAIGDVVNTASRLEAQAKTWNVPVVASVTVLERAGIAAAASRRRTVHLKGKAHALDVVEVPLFQRRKAIPAKATDQKGKSAKAPETLTDDHGGAASPVARS